MASFCHSDLLPPVDTRILGDENAQAMTIPQQVTAARRASRKLAVLDSKTKNQGLLSMADLVGKRSGEILQANAVDRKEAERSGLAHALAKRLVLTDAKLATIQASLRSVADLDDPIGRVELRRELDDGLVLSQVRVPIGVVGVIFESRPDALVQIASLAIKSGNAAILKGGTEARESNRVLHALFVEALSQVSESFGGALQLVETREEIGEVLKLDSEIDLMIPRGSSELVRFIQNNTRIPVLGHADGVCHLYIDSAADPAMAIRLLVDAKTQYPAVCNAVETLLIHKDMQSLLPQLRDALEGVELRGCDRVRTIIEAVSATDADWSSEYNDLTLSIRVVDSLSDAIDHINHYGSNHTDAIVTSDEKSAERFLSEVDSSSVLWNASTRFADGFRYGLGAEVGISTGKVHARGPVGLEGLTTTQYRVVGIGQTVDEYVSGEKTFTHRTLP